MNYEHLTDSQIQDYVDGNIGARPDDINKYYEAVYNNQYDDWDNDTGLILFGTQFSF